MRGCASVIPLVPEQRACPLRESKHSDRIRRVAAGLFAKKGFAGVGVAEIGEATGLGRGALYHHIQSKEDLLYDISSRYIKNLVETARRTVAQHPDPEDRIRRLSFDLMETVGLHLAEMTVCFREFEALAGEHYTNISRFHAEYEQIWIDAVSAGVASGAFREIDGEKVAVKGLLGMYFYSFLWLNSEGKYKPSEIGEIFADLFLRAVSK